MYLNRTDATNLVAELLGDAFIASKKIQAIKLVRGLSNAGLKESKDAVEAHVEGRYWLSDREPASTRENRLKAIRQMRQSLSELESQVYAQKDDFAAEPAVGATVMFTHVFPHGNGKVYTYVAIRDENGIWHVTGDDDHYRWSELQQKFSALRSTETFKLLG